MNIVPKKTCHIPNTNYQLPVFSDPTTESEILDKTHGFDESQPAPKLVKKTQISIDFSFALGIFKGFHCRKSAVIL